jgi:DNA gyrase subunit A
VRGIRLADGDSVISMSVLRHVEFSVEERDAYLRRRRAERLEEAGAELDEAVDPEPDEAATGEALETLTDERYAEMAELDQYILTVATNGYGKRTSAYEYAVRNRGGQGIANIHLTGEEHTVVASFPVEENDHLVLVTDAGQMIRTTVDDIRIAGRSTRGVIVFRVAGDEKVVSVGWLREDDEEVDEDNGAAPIPSGAEGGGDA